MLFTAIVEWSEVEGYEEVDVHAEYYTEAWALAKEILSRDYQEGWVIVDVLPCPANLIRSLP